MAPPKLAIDCPKHKNMMKEHTVWLMIFYAACFVCFVTLDSTMATLVMQTAAKASKRMAKLGLETAA